MKKPEEYARDIQQIELQGIRKILSTTNPAKIVVFSEDFPPYSGGVAQWAAGIARGLHQIGHSVDMLTRFREELATYAERDWPFPVRYIPGKRWPQLRTLYCYNALNEYITAFGAPELVIATTWNFARAAVPLKSRNRREFNLITVTHGLEVTRKMPRPKRWWLRHTLNRSDLVVSVSEFTRQRVLDRHKTPPEKVVALPNGVDVKKFYPGADVRELRERFNLGNGKIILTLARVIERKGHDRVIRALPRVLQAVPDAKYLICGPWEKNYLAQLQELISRLHLQQKVIFTGYMPPAELNRIYNLCDVYIMPSRELVETGDTEGFGITYLEANACEKPVIGGRSGGVGDAIVDGETGFLVDGDDVDGIAEKLILLLQDEALARRLGKAGRQRVEKRYTWEVIARELMQLYAQRQGRTASMAGG